MGIAGLLGLLELRRRCGFRIPRLNGLRHIFCAVSRATYGPHSGRARPKQGRKAKREMEKARAILSVGEEESERVAGLDVRPHRAGHAASFYEGFATRGLRVDGIRPGFVSCTFKVPPRLTDAGGNLSPGAIANLVDEVGAAVIHSEGHHMKASVDMSISYMSAAKVDVSTDALFLVSNFPKISRSQAITIYSIIHYLACISVHNLESRIAFTESRSIMMCVRDHQSKLRVVGVFASFPQWMVLCNSLSPLLLLSSHHLIPDPYYFGKQDELEIVSKVLGHKGGYSGTYVLLMNKATGEVVAEGRHSLFGKLRSKI
ncbi:hypothetical protein B296_00036405 [Ensete ventricosum]|uniref:Thioesterase domain-containing protein n=1 Tax=Ensete ventricosum TaxID=4639 RepID=A0A426YDI8_ENSVE|nr:hypothetical protein B296_00036405 [Ensete ventricosum]